MTLVPRQHAAVRPVAPFRAVQRMQPAPMRDLAAAPEDDGAGSEDALAQAQVRIAQLEAELLREREDGEAAREKARADGRAKGLAEAIAHDEERFTALREAIERASTGCIEGIDHRADLAILIARAALRRILGSDREHAAMVEAVVRHQARQIAAGSIVTVRVSAEDFPESALAELATATGAEITHGKQLASGTCLFDLALGAIDASIPVQARAVDELLARFEPGKDDPA